jgi:OOP family OmpA-OmpF porin
LSAFAERTSSCKRTASHERRPRLLLLSLTALLLAACSTPGTRVVLLPQADGAPSAVVVRAKAGRRRNHLSQPYQRATAASGASRCTRLDQADPAKVQAENRALFEMAPPRPQRYTLYFDAGGTCSRRSRRRS